MSTKNGVEKEIEHVPVLLAETIEGLHIRTEGNYLDLTGGRGGHSEAILDRLSVTGRLTVTDRHEKAVIFLKQKFANDPRVTVKQSRLSQILETSKELWDGIIADLGISSAQLADRQLGISFQNTSPLDMRLDAEIEKTASDILQTEEENCLADLFFKFGGERASRKIARAIVEDRTAKPFLTTDDLRELCERVLGKFYRNTRIHPATKVFQALRIAVNKELEEVEALVELAPRLLKSGGRLAIISFHEGEDRIVKQAFRHLEKNGFSLPSRKAIKPQREEEMQNPRSRSARLRVLEKNF